MATSRVKTDLFLTFEIAAKWQNVRYTQRSYRLISLNQPINEIWIFTSYIVNITQAAGLHDASL